jgi:YegS/Rv2252/BmrU family lipid kinase
MSVFVAVNPCAGGGRTAREWPVIERALRAMYSGLLVAKTQGRGEATDHVRNALRRGHSDIIAVGGDGTLNEAVNGFFGEDGSIAPEAVFSFITSGTGGDFRKTFGIAGGWHAAVAHLQGAGAIPLDVGRVSCLSASGAPSVRYFINIASFGLSGAIVDSVNRARIAKVFGGKFAFAFHSALDLLAYREPTVRIRTDGAFDETGTISTVAIANGQYFGGGMRVAPTARADDGLFDIVIIGSAPKHQSMAEMKLLYTGEHVKRPHVRSLRGHKVIASPVAETGARPVLIELDGENVGRLPATFEILPRALRVRC